MVDKGQNFASVATVRAAIFDILDHGNQFNDPWDGLYEDGLWTEDHANKQRVEFADAVIGRIAQLQNSANDGVNLKHLCSRHIMMAVVPDPNPPCVQCEKERKVKP